MGVIQFIDEFRGLHTKARQGRLGDLRKSTTWRRANSSPGPCCTRKV